jgi:hypothetical protein
MVSDVRITFPDKTEADLLRKCYAVGPSILAGFSGSVRIGLKLKKILCYVFRLRRLRGTEGHR